MSEISRMIVGTVTINRQTGEVVENEPNSFAELTDSAAYRLLDQKDAICLGDERLCDDCQTWEVIAVSDFIGQKYDGNFFVPMRRKLPSQHERTTE